MRTQQGLALVMALIFLVVLTILGLASVSGNILQERMAANSRDKNIAFQAAEACLRDAEKDINANISFSSAFSATCAGGLCAPLTTPSSKARWTFIDWNSTTTSRAYGSGTSSAALPDVAKQPSYIIEKLPGLPMGTGNDITLGLKASTKQESFRITAYAWGPRIETTVILQSIYVQ